MKKKIQTGAIIVSALCFIAFFVTQVIKVVGMFESPEDFSLMPLVLGVGTLIVLLGHIGLYLLIMDKQERNIIIQDEDEWWKKWNMV